MIYFGLKPFFKESPPKKRRRRRVRHVSLLERIFSTPRTVKFKAKKGGKKKHVTFELKEKDSYTQEELRELVKSGKARVRGHR